MSQTLKYIFLLFLFIFMAQNSHAGDISSAKQYGSVEERRIDNSIVQERESIRKEWQGIALRKKELKSLEEGVDKKLAEMDQKLKELRKLQNKIDALLATKATEEQKRIRELAGIYQKMSPAKAALALTGLDHQLAADLLANMKTKAAAKILDQISRQKATEISTTFSTLQLE